MQVLDRPRRAVSRRQLRWLDRESLDWEQSGAITPAARRLILDGYSAEAAERRGTIALVLIAVAMCSVGLLLLIGYNWDEIPRAAKLALVVGAVVLAYVGSAFGYARQRLLAGEVLAVLGTLLYGNAIWLVAQTLHISGRYPDAFLWWSLGTLATAWLVSSKWNGRLSALLLLAWTLLEGGFTGRFTPTFLVAWPLAIAVAYRLRDPIMLGLAAPAVALWAFFGGVGGSHSAFWLGGVALVACAVYGAARWNAEDSGMGEAWKAGGLLTLFLVFIPLTITAVHRDIRAGNADPLAVTLAVVAALTALAQSFRPSRSPADKAVLAIAAATLPWAIASWSGKLGTGHGFSIAATVLFSALALLMSVALVRSAVKTGEAEQLGAGIAFALLFLIVRWASVVDNLFWSGVLMLAAGGGLLLVARLWKKRPQAIGEGRRS